MNNKGRIKQFILKQPGIKIYRKADGRIEIPRSFIRALNWKKNPVFFRWDEQGIVVSYSSKQRVGQGLIGNGRLRVPAHLLAKAGLTTSTLRAILHKNGILITKDRSVTSAEELDDFIESLSPTQIKRFAALIYPAAECIPKRTKAVPKLIMLNGGEYLAFQPVGMPFSFTSVWDSESNSVLFQNSKLKIKTSNMLLVPGIQHIKGGFKIGFLMLTQDMFSKVSAVLQKKLNNYKTPTRYEYPVLTCWCNLDGFNVIADAPKEVSEFLIDVAAEACIEGGEFIRKTFKPANDYVKAGHMPIYLTKQNLGKV